MKAATAAEAAAAEVVAESKRMIEVGSISQLLMSIINLLCICYQSRMLLLSIISCFAICYQILTSTSYPPSFLYQVVSSLLAFATKYSLLLHSLLRSFTR
jgi:hypothetical protein